MTVDEDDTEVAEAGVACIRSGSVLGSVFNTSRGDGRIVDTETADIIEESEDEDDAEVNFFFGGSGGGAVTTGGTRGTSGLKLEPCSSCVRVRATSAFADVSYGRTPDGVEGSDSIHAGVVVGVGSLVVVLLGAAANGWG